ncbi:acyltransferase family protein [Paraburkholderia phytofirmans]|uniref:Acyltransferase family protein n=1 Tax=Paraburkholderia phytofirmans TaxID=261302 RepID=A0ABW9BRP3_9BURK
MAGRDQSIDVLRGIGIIFVVAGHAGSGTGIPVFTPYSFHMPLFFFLSGIFFRESEPERFGASALKGARSLLLPTTLCFIAYAFISYLLGRFGFSGLSRPLSLKNIFFDQFFGSGAYRFTSPYWFIPVLFFARLYFCVVHARLAVFAQRILKGRDSLLHVLFGLGYLAAALVAIHVCRRMYQFGDIQWSLVIPLRIVFGAFFYYVGYLCATYRAERALASAIALAAIYVAGQQLTSSGKVLDFWMQIMKFETTILPIITSVLGISFFYGAAILASGSRASRVIAFIGKNGMPIVLHQLFSFFLVNVILCALGVIQPATVVNQYYEWHPEHMWFVYVLAGLAVPLLIDKYLISPARNLVVSMASRLRQTPT